MARAKRKPSSLHLKIGLWSDSPLLPRSLLSLPNLRLMAIALGLLLNTALDTPLTSLMRAKRASAESIAVKRLLSNPRRCRPTCRGDVVEGVLSTVMASGRWRWAISLTAACSFHTCTPVSRGDSPVLRLWFRVSTEDPDPRSQALGGFSRTRIGSRQPRSRMMQMHSWLSSRMGLRWGKVPLQSGLTHCQKVCISG